MFESQIYMPCHLVAKKKYSISGEWSTHPPEPPPWERGENFSESVLASSSLLSWFSQGPKALL